MYLCCFVFVILICFIPITLNSRLQPFIIFIRQKPNALRPRRAVQPVEQGVVLEAEPAVEEAATLQTHLSSWRPTQPALIPQTPLAVLEPNPPKSPPSPRRPPAPKHPRARSESSTEGGHSLTSRRRTTQTRQDLTALHPLQRPTLLHHPDLNLP